MQSKGKELKACLAGKRDIESNLSWCNLEIQLRLSISKGSNWQQEPGDCGQCEPTASGQGSGSSAPQDPSLCGAGGAQE